MSCCHARVAIASLCAVAFGCGPESSEQVTGVVYADMDGSGDVSDGDEPVEGVFVVWETTEFARTDADGRFDLNIRDDGVVWVRIPDGFEPSPVWKAVAKPVADSPTAAMEFLLTPASATGDVRFIAATDTHIGVINSVEANAALLQATAGSPRPHFLVITGDLTQSNTPDEYDALAVALDNVEVPFIPVPGNHDWYDSGALYRERFGPQTYSFDSGGVHFVVLSEGFGKPAMIDFLDRDLSHVAPGTMVVGFMHFPPALAGHPNFPGDQDLVDALGDGRVNYLFTGHWHTNRVMPHPEGFLEYNTQPFVMGGVDMTPGGYRSVSKMGDGLYVTHHTTVESPVVEVVSPLPDQCVPPGTTRVVVAVEVGPQDVSIAASSDGIPIELEPSGGWTYSADLAAVPEGDHQLEITVTDSTGTNHVVSRSWCVASVASVELQNVDWPQLNQEPGHGGFAATPLEPPLITEWTRSVGGHLLGGSPVLSGNRLFVPVVDPSDGLAGGLLALDASTGEQVWELREGLSTRNSPAVSDGTVVFGGSDGVVRAADAETGELIWTFDLAEGVPPGSSLLYASPTIAGGTVYIGTVRNLVALDLQTGQARWEVEPTASWLNGTYASAAVSGDRAFVAFGREPGIQARDLATGASVWTRGAPSTVVVASPVVHNGVVYFADTATRVTAARVADGVILWQRMLDSEGFDWGHWISGTPVVAHDQLYVPTLRGTLVSLDIDTGLTLWVHRPGPSVIHPVHYQAAAESFVASPVVTGDTLWIGGADGVLRAIDAFVGDLLWSTDLRVPVMSGVVPSGCRLFVSSWDGSIRSMRSIASRCRPAVDNRPTPTAHDAIKR